MIDFEESLRNENSNKINNSYNQKNANNKQRYNKEDSTMVENNNKMNESKKKIDSGKVRGQHKELNLNKILSNAITQINSGINLPGTPILNKQVEFNNFMEDYESNNPKEINEKRYNNNNKHKNIKNNNANNVANNEKSSNSDEDNMVMENNDKIIARDNEIKTIDKKVKTINQVNLLHTSFQKNQDDFGNSMEKNKNNNQNFIKDENNKNSKNDNSSREKSSTDEDSIGMENNNKINHRDIEIDNGKIKIIEKKVNQINNDNDKDYDTETEETLDNPTKEKANVENLNSNETGNIWHHVFLPNGHSLNGVIPNRALF